MQENQKAAYTGSNPLIVQHMTDDIRSIGKMLLALIGEANIPQCSQELKNFIELTGVSGMESILGLLQIHLGREAPTRDMHSSRRKRAQWSSVVPELCPGRKVYTPTCNRQRRHLYIGLYRPPYKAVIEESQGAGRLRGFCHTGTGIFYPSDASVKREAYDCSTYGLAEQLQEARNTLPKNLSSAGKEVFLFEKSRGAAWCNKRKSITGACSNLYGSGGGCWGVFRCSR